MTRFDYIYEVDGQVYYMYEVDVQVYYMYEVDEQVYYKSVFFSPIMAIIILFLQYSRKRSFHVPEI
jgi:hypothetical protein